MSVVRWFSAFRGLDPFACHRSSLWPLPSGPRVKPFPPDKSPKGFLGCIRRTLYTIQCTRAWESHCSLYASTRPYSGLAGGCVCQIATWRFIRTFMTHYAIAQEAAIDAALGQAMLQTVLPLAFSHPPPPIQVGTTPLEEPPVSSDQPPLPYLQGYCEDQYPQDHVMLTY